MTYLQSYLPKGDKLAAPSQVVTGPGFRITVLTSRMLRLEYQPDDCFMDHQTKTVVNRAFPPVEFTTYRSPRGIEIVTEHLHLRYDMDLFSETGLSVELRQACSIYNNRWHYGMAVETLKGTARTLDEADGAIPLSDGLISNRGITVIDDSSSPYFGEEGFLHPREKEGVDLYILGYGLDYLGCLKDFYSLSGHTPLLPRYALGNWWSRFYRYTDETYRELVRRFQAEEVPLSVCVIDMDWHLTDIDPKYGSGWTGYTWNRDLFPDPAAFMAFLHEQDLRVTLNVHPADGCRAFEEYYPAIAEAMGVANAEKVDFDASNPAFIEAYLRHLHHPNEEMGVDFWWLDWQQQGGTKVKALDPLFILNHYHFMDNGRDGKQPLTFSRYAGLGSHRTPIGFSGDTFATWESLDFQPYFTATASNVGYGWWSHDIGGHMHGTKDDDMAMRWLQFGVFSPIMRLHSSGNPFMSKEPWSYNSFYAAIAKRFMRLRHQLIPYLHTMNYRSHKEGVPLIEPMYYRYPQSAEAYEVPNQYFFGSELIVCPMTKPVHPKLQTAAFDAWLPKGVYYDIFSGTRYVGGRKLTLHRSVETLPVLLCPGAILPMAQECTLKNGVDLPEALDIHISLEGERTFSLFEDGEGKEAYTTMVLSKESRWTFSLSPVLGEASILPVKRRITLKVYGLMDAGSINVDGNTLESVTQSGLLTTLVFGEMDTAAGMTVIFGALEKEPENDKRALAFALLDRAQIPYDMKADLFREVLRQSNGAFIISQLMAKHLDETLLSALTEILTA